MPPIFNPAGKSKLIVLLWVLWKLISIPFRFLALLPVIIRYHRGIARLNAKTEAERLDRLRHPSRYLAENDP
jgi:hypothetical protein